MVLPKGEVVRPKGEVEPDLSFSLDPRTDLGSRTQMPESVLFIQANTVFSRSLVRD